ncbi:MAG TPA: ADP-ribosylation factor-like protein [Polyangiaceae bacterium]|nr:ADP-ribosylation factor-like protein [Polyangiaceae bacterium]
MPRIDRRSGEIVIRIIFDGPAEAGKTTTIDHLASVISLQRRSPVTRPGTTERQTEFFDWLDFSGGFLDGFRVRCQLLSVPGHSSVLHRRRYLLDSADVIVFVADAAATQLDELRRDFAVSRSAIEQQGSQIPVGMVLQVNKQDLPDALTSDAVASALGLSASTPVIGTSARDGQGVMQTLILAVRLATDRVRALLLDEELAELRPSEAQPDELHRAMLALEPALNEVSCAKGAAEPAREPGPAHTFRELAGLGQRSNARAVAPHLLPQANALPAGCIWPAVSGRAALAAANQGQIEVPATLADFAPPHAFQLGSDNGWLFHSSESWSFASEGEARLALLSIARALAETTDLLPEGRALMVAPDTAGFRLWMLTRQTIAISELVAIALQDGDAAALAQAWIAVHEFVRASPALSRLAAAARLNTLAAQRGRMVVLALPDGEGESGESPVAELERLLELMRQRSATSARCIADARALVFQHESRTRRKDQS